MSLKTFYLNFLLTGTSLILPFSQPSTDSRVYLLTDSTSQKSQVVYTQPLPHGGVLVIDSQGTRLLLTDEQED